MQRPMPPIRGKGLARGIPAVLSVVSAFALWEIYVRVSGISPLLLPAPSRVVDQIVRNRALLWGHTVPTITATLTGFACSAVVAFALSIILDFMPRARRALFPIFVISQTLPLVAIAPLVVLWLGFDLTPKIMLVALVDGYEATDPEIEALLRSMGASRASVFRIARLPEPSFRRLNVAMSSQQSITK
jgi:ABC-type nitrate/sulfonate/bicarbonate transport system permease component